MFNHIEELSLTNQLCQLETLEAAWRKVRANMRSRQYLTQQQKNIHTRLSKCLKKATHRKQSIKHS